MSIGRLIPAVLLGAACTCEPPLPPPEFFCRSDRDCQGVPCVAGVCGGKGVGGGGGLSNGGGGGEAGGAGGGFSEAGGGGEAVGGGAGGGQSGGAAAGVGGGGATGGAGGNTDGGFDGGLLPRSMAFVTPPFTVPAGVCSPAVTVQLRDGFGNPAGAPVPLTVGLSGTPGVSFFNDTACAATATGLAFDAGVSAASFYFRGTTGGTNTVRANHASLGMASQDHNVVGLLRVGTCTLNAGASQVDCTVTPPVADPDKALLVFQAPTAADTPMNGYTRCRLADAANINCNRAGNMGTVRVQWQVLELPRGLRVQRVGTVCSTQPTWGVPIAPVSTTGAFVLKSQSGGAFLFSADDSSTYELTSNAVGFTIGDMDGGSLCPNNYAVDVQVVELAGATVHRGFAGDLPPFQPSLQVSGLPQVSPPSSALLFSHRIQSLNQGICEFTVRGRFATGTGLFFSRGEGALDAGCLESNIEALNYERIDFGTRATVQSFTVSMDAGVLSEVATLNPVDVTRTVVFSSSQLGCGQGLGEGTYHDNDVLGELCASFELVSATQVRLVRETAFATGKWTGYAVQFNP